MPITATPARRTRAAAIVSATALLAAACGSSEGSGDAETRDGSDHYPVTVENCGDEVTIEAEPTNVVMLKSAVVPFLTSVGVLDHVTAKAGAYPDGYFSDDDAKQIEEIETLTDRTDSSGHLLISKETVVEREPDLVLGQTDNLNRESLDEVGIPTLEASGLCPKNLPKPGFQQVYDEIEMYGQVFNREDEADEQRLLLAGGGETGRHRFVEMGDDEIAAMRPFQRPPGGAVERARAGQTLGDFVLGLAGGPGEVEIGIAGRKLQPRRREGRVSARRE